MPASSPVPVPPGPRNGPVRWFGRWQLLRLLGKSERTMAWRVADPVSEQELILVLPRVQPSDPTALEQWQQAMRQAARLSHPQLAAVVDLGVQDGWPFAAYDPKQEVTLSERLPANGLPGPEGAALAQQALQGLAFAHEAGLAHHDIQPFLVLVGDSGQLRLTGLSVAAELAARQAAVPAGEPPGPTGRQGQRAAAERDLLATGVLMHLVLTGQPALEEDDIGRVVERLAPRGRDLLRLPWQTAHRIPEPLRAIVNRSTDRQERQRYRNARTLLRALEGWLQTEGNADSGPLALLSDRLRTAGVLPSSPGAASRVARLALMETQRTFELAEVVLEDLALSFEMLRLANSVQARAAGSGAVLTVRRAIAMLGLDGVRRAALALREWPGPLDDAGAQRLQELLDRSRRAARAAIALRPAGYDGEVVYLLTLMQGLGRMVVQYHFPDEAQQIHRLMQAAPSPRAGEPDEPGMTEEAAAYAVLGSDIDAIGQAVLRHWGFDETLMKLTLRLPLSTPVRSPDNDDDLLRATASCANEAVDAQSLPAPKVAAALQRVVQRYGRLLDIDQRQLQDALRGEARLTEPMMQTQTAPLDEAPVEPRRGSALRAGANR